MVDARMKCRTSASNEGKGETMTNDITVDQHSMLRGMALCCQDNTGKLPTTMKELADHWYDLSDTLVILDPPERLIDVDTDHMRQCVWLRDLEKRPNADTILAAATAHGTPRRTCST